MNKTYINAILTVTSLSFSAGAMAQNMSKSEYTAVEKNIEVEYKSAKANCASFADNAQDICVAVAKRTKKVAKAELDARYKPLKRRTTKSVLPRRKRITRWPKKSAMTLRAMSKTSV